MLPQVLLARVCTAGEDSPGGAAVLPERAVSGCAARPAGHVCRSQPGLPARHDVVLPVLDWPVPAGAQEPARVLQGLPHSAGTAARTEVEFVLGLCKVWVKARMSD